MLLQYHSIITQIFKIEIYWSVQMKRFELTQWLRLIKLNNAERLLTFQIYKIYDQSAYIKKKMGKTFYSLVACLQFLKPYRRTFITTRLQKRCFLLSQILEYIIFYWSQQNKLQKRKRNEKFLISFVYSFSSFFLFPLKVEGYQ